MLSQRPYFPYEEIEVIQLPYPRFTGEEVCGWDTLITAEDCKTGEVAFDLYAKTEWQPVRMEVNKVKSDDGKGGQIVDQVRLDPVYGVKIFVDEYIRWYVWKMFTQATKINFERDSNDITGYDFDIEEQEVSKGIHQMIISFKAADGDAYHGPKGIGNCCDPLYTSAPFEDCEENAGDIDNNVPPCDTVDFSIAATGDNLNATVSGTPGAYTVAWYYRLTESSAWTLLIADAAGITMASAGYYRAVLNAVGCGQYFRQYFVEGCSLTVRIRQGAGGALTAEIPTGATATYVWEYNDGMGWTTLPDTTQSILATDSGTYRVTASDGDCDRQDIAQVIVNAAPCDFTVEIDVSGTTATASTDASSPTYQWIRINESGSVVIGTGSSVQLTATGMYYLYVTDSGCTVSAMYYHKQADGTLPFRLTMMNLIGYEFVVYDIDLNDYAPSQYVVMRGGEVQNYTASTPTLDDEFTVLPTGEIRFSEFHPLENETVKIAVN